MPKALVIVESPAKAKTINKYLGKQYIVKASLGHIKDLPKRDLAVDIEHGFEPRYEVIEGKRKLITELKQAAKKVESVYLAADPDREGEAICFHLQEELRDNRKDAPRVYRVMFNEITKKAIEKAFEKPGQVDINLVDAQQARRVLDRLVGYKISPLLWDKVRRGLSAGRVQTVALRVIVEREREIRAFVPKEYWTIDADLHAKKPPLLTARLIKIGDQPAEVGSQQTSDEVLAALDGADYVVKSVGTREKKRNPVAPFITSTLQQESARKLRFSVKRTMMLAQRLYEGVEIGKEGAVGLITYMRTDSTRVSEDAIRDVRDYIAGALRQAFSPGSADRLQVEERGAGRARGHPPHLHGADSGSGGDVSRRRRDEVVPADLEPVRGLPDDARAVRPDHHRRNGHGQDRRGLHCSAPPAPFRSFEGFLKVYEEGKDQTDEEDEELKHRLPLVAEGERLRLQGHPRRPALHRAAAALQRSHPGEATGSRWRRPAFDLRLHSLHHPGARVRQEGGRTLRSHRARHGGDRPAARELRRHLRREIHGAHGRGAGRDRRRQARLARRHGRVLRALRPRPEARRRAHDRHQADGETHRLDRARSAANPW